MTQPTDEKPFGAPGCSCKKLHHNTIEVNPTCPIHGEKKSMTTKRKFIQIAACGVAENHQTQCEALIFGLADDGTVWQCDNRGSGWHSMDSCPQVEVTQFLERQLQRTLKALKEVYDETEGIEDGAPDSTHEALLANRICGIVRPFIK